MVENFKYVLTLEIIPLEEETHSNTVFYVV